MKRMKSILAGRKAAMACFIAVCIYTGGDLWQNLIWPPFFSLDETLEIDYVYQLTRGKLPTFFGGAEFNPLHLHYAFDVQYRYQHPPLFYLSETPIFLLFDTIHHPIRGIWAMRALVYVFGVVSILVSYWAARWIIGRNNIATYLVPIIFASNRCLPSVVLNYTLASLWVTMLIGGTCYFIRKGFTDQRKTTYAIWTLVVLLAPLTRLSTVPILLLCLVVLAITATFAKKTPRSRAGTIGHVCVMPLLAAILSSSWFYIRLYRLSGHLTGSQPAWQLEHLHRSIDKNIHQTLLSPTFYIHSFSQYQNMQTVTDGRFGTAFVILLTFLPLLAGMIALVQRCFLRIREYRRQPAPRDIAKLHDLIIAILLFCALGGTTIQQLLFYRQGGSYNAVYFSLINIVFASIIATGLRWTGRAWKASASLWLALRLAALLYEAKRNWTTSGWIALANAGTRMHIALVLSLVIVAIGTLAGVVYVHMSSNRRSTLPPSGENSSECAEVAQ